MLPFYINNMSFVIIAADKVVAINFPFKRKRMMTPRVVAAVIGGAWLVAVIPILFPRSSSMWMVSLMCQNMVPAYLKELLTLKQS